MKKALLLFTILTFIGCTESLPANNTDPNREKIIAKNKQTAAINEATLITQTAQKIEHEGRGMETYRNSSSPQSPRECQSVMADEQKQVQDLADRIAKLPEEYKPSLTPITGDLNDCVSCSKKAMESCVKARASINGAIKTLFP